MSALTLAALACARGLAPELLQKLGWQERSTGVAIPWPLAGGGVAWHLRHRLEREGPRHGPGTGAGPRWTWQHFDRNRLLPYGHERLLRMRERAPEVLVIVESEVDAICLWSADIAALAAGGADGWQGRWWALARDFHKVAVWLEDAGSLPLVRCLVQTQPDDAPPLYVCHSLAGPAKDPGRILAALNGTGREALRRIVAGAVPVTRLARDEGTLLSMVTERLDARRGQSGFQARCPFHDDGTPSLSIFQGEDGGWAFRCHGGSCGARGPLALLAACLGIALVPRADAPSSAVGASASGCVAPTLKSAAVGATQTSGSVAPTPPFLGEGVGATQRSPFVPASDLAADGEPGESGVAWLSLMGVSGFVGRGLFTLLSARPKAGKTTLVAHAVRRWLAEGLRVVWLSEEPRPLWRGRIAKLGLGSPNLLLAFSDGSDSATWAERLRAERPDVDVVVVDTARAFLGIVDENDAAQVHRALTPLVQAARELDAALLVLHHRRKADGDEGTDHAGSHAFVGDADIAITLKETQDPRRRELLARSRFEETPAKLLVELFEGEYRALGTPEAVEAAEVRARVQMVLSEEWQPTKAITESLTEPRPSAEAVRRALHELVAAGVAVRSPGRGRQPDQWRLARSEGAEAREAEAEADGNVVGADEDADGDGDNEGSVVLLQQPLSIVGATQPPSELLALTDAGADDLPWDHVPAGAGAPAHADDSDAEPDVAWPRSRADGANDGAGAVAVDGHGACTARGIAVAGAPADSAVGVEPACPRCGGSLDGGFACWRCSEGYCRICGHVTGSPLRGLCLRCGISETAGTGPGEVRDERARAPACAVLPG